MHSCSIAVTTANSTPKQYQLIVPRVLLKIGKQNVAVCTGTGSTLRNE